MHTYRPEIRGLIFDFDGTLADTIPICIEAFQIAVREHSGRSMDPGQVRARFGPTEEGMLQRALPDCFERAFDTYLKAYERLHATIDEPFSGIVPLIESLRRETVALAIVTGKGRQAMEISCRMLGLDSYFPLIETGSREEPIKAQSIRRVLKRWSIESTQVAYVGDMPSDMRDAKTCGIHAIGAAWSADADPEELSASGAGIVFASVAAFSSWAITATR